MSRNISTISFDSIFIQAVDPDCLEIITVDDGSTDVTAARIADWAERFPASIRYLHQPNQGQAVARNTGLARATGEWVSFPDPDDTLSTSYFEEVDAEIARAHSQPLSMVACNLVFFKEAKRRAKEAGHASVTLPVRARSHDLAGVRPPRSHATLYSDGLAPPGAHRAKRACVSIRASFPPSKTGIS